jgi:hypothetical protein
VVPELHYIKKSEIFQYNRVVFSIESAEAGGQGWEWSLRSSKGGGIVIQPDGWYIFVLITFKEEGY